MIPDDLVLVGHVIGAYGIRGWIRIKSYSPDSAALLYGRTWWLDKPLLRDIDVMSVKNHGEDIVAQVMGVMDRNAAEALIGASVKIRRSHFPPLSNNEFYWVDLIGLDVENFQGQCMGVVRDLIDNGAHPILLVGLPPIDPAKKSRQFLIPFVDQFIKAVDQSAKKIIVDWGLDY